MWTYESAIKAIESASSIYGVMPKPTVKWYKNIATGIRDSTWRTPEQKSRDYRKVIDAVAAWVNHKQLRSFYMIVRDAALKTGGQLVGAGKEVGSRLVKVLDVFTQPIMLIILLGVALLLFTPLGKRIGK